MGIEIAYIIWYNVWVKEKVMAEKKVEFVSREEINAASINEGNFSGAKNSKEMPSNFRNFLKDYKFSPAKLKNQSKVLSNLSSSNNADLNQVAKTINYAIVNGNYVNKLKDSEIENWFEPFGYVNHERYDGLAHVWCKDFEIIFNNFEVVFNKHENCDLGFANAVSKMDDDKFIKLFNYEGFDFNEFESTCDSMDTTPALALEEYVAIKFSERFPSSYPIERKNYKDERTKKAFKSFEKSGADKKIVDLVREIKNKQDISHEATHLRGHYGVYKPDNN